MKLKDLFEDQDIGTKFSIKAGSKVHQVIDQLTDFARKFDKNVDWKGVSMRMWTRSDGVRYKEPGYVLMSSSKLANEVFERIPGTLIKVRGEFSSTSYAPAKKSGKFLFVNRGKFIHVSSTSVLRNVDVWKTEKTEEK